MGLLSCPQRTFPAFSLKLPTLKGRDLMMTDEEFALFFEQYSKNVDSADNQAFWRLSDALVLEVLRRHVLSVAETGIILDAGGGTGRWISRLLPLSKGSFILFDKSRHMLDRAASNLQDASALNRAVLIEGDLENMEKIKDGSVDSVMSLYGPISFVGSPANMMKEISRVLKPGGTAVVMGHSMYNALFSKINNYLASRDELNRILEDGRVKWAEHVPHLHVFSSETMRQLLPGTGLNLVKFYGIPVLTQPGPEDFDPDNVKRSRISLHLEDKESFISLFELEKNLFDREHLVDRGVNLVMVVSK